MIEVLAQLTREFSAGHRDAGQNRIAEQLDV
jgi:hypothetical protein